MLKHRFDSKRVCLDSNGCLQEIPLTDWIWDERVKSLKTKILQQRQLIEENVEIDNKLEDNKDDNATDEEIEMAEDLQPTTSIFDDSLPKKFFLMNNIELEMAKLPNRKKVRILSHRLTLTISHRELV